MNIPVEEWKKFRPDEIATIGAARAGMNIPPAWIVKATGFDAFDVDGAHPHDIPLKHDSIADHVVRYLAILVDGHVHHDAYDPNEALIGYRPEQKSSLDASDPDNASSFKENGDQTGEGDNDEAENDINKPDKPVDPAQAVATALKAGATAIKAATTPEEKRAAYRKQLAERQAAYKEKFSGVAKDWAARRGPRSGRQVDGWYW